MQPHEQRLQLVIQGVLKDSTKVGKRLDVIIAPFGMAITCRHGSRDKRLHVDPRSGDFERNIR